MNMSSYNLGNKAREHYQATVNCLTAGKVYLGFPNWVQVVQAAFSGYTEGIKAQAGRFLTVTYLLGLFYFAKKNMEVL